MKSRFLCFLLLASLHMVRLMTLHTEFGQMNVMTDENGGFIDMEDSSVFVHISSKNLIEAYAVLPLKKFGDATVTKLAQMFHLRIDQQDNSYPFEKTWMEGTYDGDELLTTQQKREIQTKKRIKRKFRKIPIFLWPEGVVPYKFSSGIRQFERSSTYKNISYAMSYIEKWTCINFVNIKTDKEEYERLLPKLSHSSYLEIGKAYSCASNIGFPGDGQIAKIFLNETMGCTLPGIVVHELGHILGFLHEHSRSDRDQFVTVNWENVVPGTQLNFQKTNTDNFAPYDYGSAMHYSTKAFSKNGQDTISSRDPLLKFLMGRRSGFSFYDAKSINKAYQCAENCSSPTSCQNDGFLLNCRCICPRYFKGSQCQLFAPFSSTKTFNETCSRFVRLRTDQFITVTSPNYPRSYNGSRCSYFFKISYGYLPTPCTIAPHDLRAQTKLKMWLSGLDKQGPEGTKVNVSLYIIYIPANRSTHTCFHWLEVRYTLLGQRGPRFCGENSSYSLTSRDNWTLVVFNGSDTEHAGRGFLMNISVISEIEGNSISQNYRNSSSSNTIFTTPPSISSVTTTHFTRTCQNGGSLTSGDCLCIAEFVGEKCDTLENVSCGFELNASKEVCIIEQWKNNKDDGQWILDNSGALIANISGTSNAVLHLPKIQQSEDRLKCLKIIFELNGNASLEVILKSLVTNKTSTWTASKTGKHNVSFSVYSGEVFEVYIVGSIEDAVLDMVSLKTLQIQNGQCNTSFFIPVCLFPQTDQMTGNESQSLPFSCTFDVGPCNFSIVNGGWELTPTGDRDEESYRWTNGSYFKNAAHFIKSKPAYILSPVLQTCTGACVSFSYYAEGHEVGDLSLKVKHEGEIETKWLLPLNTSSKPIWTEVRQSMNIVSSKFQIIFEHGPENFSGYYRIDNVLVTSGHCL